MSTNSVLNLKTVTNNDIAASFGAVAQNYDTYAVVQKRAAQRLMELVRPHLKYVSGPVLEFGCGTGFVTEKIVTQLNGSSFEITDISEEMLHVCKAKLADAPGLSFFPLDIEKLEARDHYGLIISGLTAQWLENIQKSTILLCSALKPDGILAFSYMNQKSFPQWKALCHDTKTKYTGNPLPSPDAVRQLGPKYKTLILNEVYKEMYESPLDFFSHLKKIGAGVQTNGSPRSATNMKGLDAHWRKKKRKHFTITYGVTYCVIHRLI